MNQPSGPQDSLVLSYLELRRAVGIIGCALPFVLAVGKIRWDGPGLQDTISLYYYTDMRNVFVGSLCAIGVFLMSYRGYDWRDRIAGKLACICAIGVALFPTTPPGATSREQTIGTLHLSFAALLFLSLAYFCLALFTETAQGKNPTRRKLQRNIVYRFCGSMILACIVCILVVTRPPVFWLESLAVVALGVYWLIKGETIFRNIVYRLCGSIIPASVASIFVVARPPVFWLESVAIFVFGVSWLTKGETILGDSWGQVQGTPP